jgi:hypothetical protein
MSDTIDRLEHVLRQAEQARIPVIVDERTLRAAVDEIRALTPRGRVNLSAYEKGREAGVRQEKRANAAGEQALTAKVAKTIELVGRWDAHVDDLDSDDDAAQVLRQAATELRATLGLGDVAISCPCGEHR